VVIQMLTCCLLCCALCCSCYYCCSGIVLRVLFHPRQLMLFSSCDQGEVRVWDLVTKAPAFKSMAKVSVFSTNHQQTLQLLWCLDCTPLCQQQRICVCRPIFLVIIVSFAPPPSQSVPPFPTLCPQHTPPPLHPPPHTHTPRAT